MSGGFGNTFAVFELTFDDLLERVYEAYKAVPGPEQLTVGLRGVSLHRLFKAAGNNVRHYGEWSKTLWELASTNPELRNRKRVQCNIDVLAQALDHPRPVQIKHLSNYGMNLAWMVVLAVGGSYAVLEELIRAELLEMIGGLGVMNEPWVQHELRIDCSSYGTAITVGVRAPGRLVNVVGDDA